MRFGVFDHLDDNGLSAGELFENRLRLAEAYDRSGIHGYHVAEHHATPLGLSPSPSVFLAAVAQRTERLLLGPLVYTLALYHPLRLAEEICMLDHLSRGRFQLGIGRGVSPIEMDMYGVDVPKAQARYLEAFQVIMQALATRRLTHEGEFFRFREVPIQLAPVQTPHPPLWYGLGNPDAVPWVAQYRVNSVSLLPPARIRAITDRYREEWSKLGRDAASIPCMGMTRHIVIAPTDEEAMAIARRAYRRWHASFWYLWKSHNRLGVTPLYAAYPDSYDDLLGRGQALAGSPETVRGALAAQIAEAGVNYVLLDLAFGDLSVDESLRTLDLFTRHVKPALA